MKQQLLASTAPVECLAAAAPAEKAAEESKHTGGWKQRNLVSRRKPDHRHHARDGDRGDDGGDDGGGDGDGAPDVLVPDPVVAKELSVTSMTIWRWDRDPAMAELGWPPRVSIRNRNHRFRRPLEHFKQNLMRRAIAARAQLRAATASAE